MTDQFRKDVKRGLLDVAVLFSIFVLMFSLLIFAVVNAEAIDALTELYQNELFIWVYHHRLPLGISILISGVLGSIWWVKKRF